MSSIFILLVLTHHIFGEDTGHCSAMTDSCTETNYWGTFDWKSYIEKDLTVENIEDPLSKYGVDVVKSYETAYNRSIPDFRIHGCNKFSTVKDSTIVSIIERTPKELLKEIILVDDGNEDSSIGEELSVIKKVKLIRNQKREGLIRSRIIGAKATSDNVVMIFLDSHCEVGYDWVLPLLETIFVYPKSIVSPVDLIGLLISFGNLLHIKMNFKENYSHTIVFQLQPSPEACSQLKRTGFFELGAYDEGMEIWGVENIELSVRAWTCGGALRIAPCSRVGHIYKLSQPYDYPIGKTKTLECNKIRFSKVWLDQFEVLFRSTIQKSHISNDIECGDILPRIKLRKDLECKSFQWYLENIYPNMPIPNFGDIGFGSIFSRSDPYWLNCVDTISPGDEGTDKFNRNDFCWTIQKGTDNIKPIYCDSQNQFQKWTPIYPNKSSKVTAGYSFFNNETDKCIEVSSEKKLIGAACDLENLNQRFMFEMNSSP
ncbi:GALNT [Lepeophtheirus salmonis]|uniref:Polypeptide N-acetylgalactosaminyltransferase n=1 Tax=Lepeophtheirus salmonis TaxID=72036 RepID=A0A7R8D330_LEPSM|nr:GALNT [Lepeophtheirus salmonis]CAF3012760.1 GALNT [Lepeophtheirus salmonis]